MTERFTAKYEIEDGYVGGSRPQSFHISEDELPDEATDEELLELFEALAHEDMLQRVSASEMNRDDFIEWAKARIASNVEA